MGTAAMVTLERVARICSLFAVLQAFAPKSRERRVSQKWVDDPGMDG
jgi:hypothetical protein